MSDDVNTPKIVVVCGPTGVGKTRFAISLARRFGGEIVGADSMQIYRLMDIGTAKPTEAERTAVTHHMVDIIDPRDDFDAAEFARQADACVTRLLQDGKLPLVAGGTGLYIKALLYGLTDAAPSDPAVRQSLNQALRDVGAPAMHRRLAGIDALSARRIHPNDGYRIIRALEVYAISGIPMSSLHGAHGFKKRRYDAFQIGLRLPRQELYDRIDRRVELMLEQGFVEEVRMLLRKGYSPGLKSMQSLGYRHMVDFLQGRTDRQEAVRLMKRDHRRYAKRQLTWFGADASVWWLTPGDTEIAAARIEDFLNGGTNYDDTSTR